MSEPVTILFSQLRQLWTDITLTAEGNTTDYHRDVLSVGKPESAHLSFGRHLPIQVEFERWMARSVEYWRTRVHGRPGGPADQDKTSEARKAQREAVLATPGDPTAVAYLHGLKEQGVRRIRSRAGQDPASGIPLSHIRDEHIDGKQTHPRPLTAPARDTMERLECESSD